MFWLVGLLTVAYAVGRIAGRAFRWWKPRYAVYHRVTKKNRRDALKPCRGVAFYRRVKGPIPAHEIPLVCRTCKQMLQTRHLDLHEVLKDVIVIDPSRGRQPRHYHGTGLITELAPSKESQ